MTPALQSIRDNLERERDRLRGHINAARAAAESAHICELRLSTELDRLFAHLRADPQQAGAHASVSSPTRPASSDAGHFGEIA